MKLRLDTIKQSINRKEIILRKSPLTPLFQRGEFLPFAKGGEEGFSFQCLHNYGLINKLLFT